MKGYLRAVLGGFLAILAAFGWTVGIAFFAMLKGDTIVGVEVNKGGLYLLIPLFLVFSAGFILAFRAAYSRSSN